MDVNNLLAQLKPEIARIDQALKEDLSLVTNRQLADLLEYAIFNGGKRIRPLLTILAYRMAKKSEGGDNEAEEKGAYALAIAFEYLHVASLLHDDVIDHADTRRGRPAANKVWGKTPVILAGDYLHSRALALAGGSGRGEILQVVCGSTAAMVESEFVQMESVAQQDRSEKSYFRVLQGKTAALIAAACKTGAKYGGASGRETEALNIFGNNLGLAFQIIDDLLDYLGDSVKTGKATGNDFVEGKMTLPLIYALDHCPAADQGKINGLLSGPPRERSKKLVMVRNIINKAGGFTYARTKAEILMADALKGLGLFIDCPEKLILQGLTLYVLNREK